MIKKITGIFLSATISAVAFSGTAYAQTDWPERSVQLVLPYTPGGATDRLARIMAEYLHEPLQQPFVVDNRPGATGAVGSGYVARANPDGYTYLFGFAGSMVLAPLLRSNLPYDSLEDFDPVARLVTYDFVLVARPDYPADTLEELIELGRDGELIEYGTHGVGSPSHLSMENVSLNSEVQMTHVPYKGEQPMVSDLLGDHIQLGWLTVNVAEPYIKDGSLKPIVIGSYQRFPKLPDTPTMEESGFSDAGFEVWAGLMAPAGTPTEIIDTFSAELEVLLENKSLEEDLIAANFLPAYLGPEAFKQLIVDELERYDALIEAAGVERQ